MPCHEFMPTGIFYAQGVKANVLFFDEAPAAERAGPRSCGSTTCAPTSTSRSSRTRCAASTSTTSSPATPGKTAPSASSRAVPGLHLRRADGRDKANLDITWLRDESLEDPDNLPAPEVIAAEIVEDLKAALVSSKRSPPIWQPGPHDRGGGPLSEEKTLFKRVDYDVQGLIEYIELGEIGLPDIQRPFVWTQPRSATCSTRCTRASRSATCCSGRTGRRAAPGRSGPSASSTRPHC